MPNAPEPSLSPATYRALVHSVHEAIVIADHEGTIVEFNPAAVEMFGHARQAMLGEPLTRIMPERYRRAFEAGLQRYHETGRSIVIGETMEVRGLRRNGDPFPLEVTLDAWDGPDGNRYFSGILRDLTTLPRTSNDAELEPEDLELA